MAKFIIFISIPLLYAVFLADAWGEQKNEAVLLRDINVLTLHHGRMSTARRSSPVPQLKCVGGNAGCSFVPQVVQCYNRGWDGNDVQWECKSDMDNAYRFGQVEVTCEGYNYPDDPYVLTGSCGLEYTIDLTQEGHQQKQSGHQSQHSYYGDDTHGGSSSHKKSSGIFGDLLILVVIGIVIYVIYVKCLSNGNNMADRGAPPPYGTHRDHSRPSGNPGGNPPPYGFRDEYMPNNDDADCTRNRTQTNNSSQPTGNESTGGGFWTGAGLGGMLGYMFGSRTNTGYGYGRSYGHNPGYGNSWWNRGWGGGTMGRGYGSSGWGSGFATPHTTTRTGFGGGGFGGGGARSSGTRTASGFGGTRRR